MGQRLLLQIAEEVGTACMAALTPARAITQTVVVIHPLNRKTGRACVAGVAAHACAGKQLRLVRDVVAGRDFPGSTLNMAAGASASARGYTGMIKRATGERCITRMALITRRRGGCVRGRRLGFAQYVQCGISAVVAGCALTGHHTLCCRVIECRRIKRRHVVTLIARRTGRDVAVPARFRQASTTLNMATAVGAGAGAGDDARMIIGAGKGGITRMAFITRVRGGDMIGRLAQGVRTGV